MANIVQRLLRLDRRAHGGSARSGQPRSDTTVLKSIATPRRIQLVIGLAVSAVALYFVLRDLQWSGVSTAVREADYALIFVALLTFLGVILLRALRWRALLQPDGNLRLWHLYGSLNVAYFINNILPLHTGDIWRAFLLSGLAGMSTSRTLSTVVVERVIDVLTLLLLLLVLALFLDIPAWARGPALTIALVFTLLTAALIVASARRGFMLGLLEKLFSLAPAGLRDKLREMAGSGLDGLTVLTRPARALQLLAYSAAIWLVAAGSLYAGMQAFGLGLGYDVAVFLLVMTTFGFFVPASPGSFGVYHAIIIGILTSVFDAEKTAAVSYALVIHLVFYLPPMVIGPAFLWLVRSSWRTASIFDKIAQLRGQPAAIAQD